MNIQSTRRPIAAQKPVQQNQSPSPKASAFQDGLAGIAHYVGGAAGLMTGVVTGATAAIHGAARLGITDATLLWVGAVVIGGATGAVAGFQLTKLAGKAASAISERTGVSAPSGHALGAVLASSAGMGLVTGSVTGALIGAGVAVVGGGVNALVNKK